jgi:hypothetical protein
MWIGSIMGPNTGINGLAGGRDNRCWSKAEENGATGYKLGNRARVWTENMGSNIDGVVHEDNKRDDEVAGRLTEPMRGLESTSHRRDSKVATFVLANVRNNENFCLGFSVSVDGDEGGDSYSPLGDFELELGGGDEKKGDNDGNNEDDKTVRREFEDHGNGDGVGDDNGAEDDGESGDL